MLLKSYECVVSEKKVDVPIRLYTSNYDKEFALFVRLVNDLPHGLGKMGCLTKYKEEGGVVRGISFCFYFINLQTREPIVVEFQVFDRINLKSNELFYYEQYVERKLQNHPFDWNNYAIGHMDARLKEEWAIED